MATFKNLKDLEKYAQKAITNAMKKEVSNVARSTLKEHIVEDVYDEYTPSGRNPYERTGGLLQDSNIETKMVDDNTLSVRSTREEDGRDIAAVIEYGYPYTWEDSQIYKMQPFPRPFHALAAKELEEKELAKKALKKGLERQGIDVK